MHQQCLANMERFLGEVRVMTISSLSATKFFTNSHSLTTPSFIHVHLFLGCQRFVLHLPNHLWQAPHHARLRLAVRRPRLELLDPLQGEGSRGGVGRVPPRDVRFGQAEVCVHLCAIEDGVSQFLSHDLFEDEWGGGERVRELYWVRHWICRFVFVCLD